MSQTHYMTIDPLMQLHLVLKLIHHKLMAFLLNKLVLFTFHHQLLRFKVKFKITGLIIVYLKICYRKFILKTSLATRLK